MIHKRPGTGLLTAMTLAIGMLAWGACGKKELPAAVRDRGRAVPPGRLVLDLQGRGLDLERAGQTITLTYMKDDEYKNAGVLAFAAGSETILYDRDLNFVAVASNGRILREASPSLRSFDFPFYVGKQWRSVFTFQDNQKGLSWTPVEVFWHVKEYDEVSVPAGKFRAFLLESEPSTNWGIRREQVWYAPQAKQLVKRLRERTSAHYEGKGKDTWELVQYTLK